ncbi:MAG: ABC transporter ATP-binding protein [Oscillospiraceae bacterium]|nr:ABC transporter ATP-binding protein [Oscillospiraceae bacterium]
MSTVLSVKDLKVHFNDASDERFAVNGISFDIEEGEIVGLVGESGSGKSVTAMSIGGLLAKERAEISGSITLDGKEIFNCSPQEMRSLQGDELGIVFQEPMSAMDPLIKVGKQVEEPLKIHKKMTKKERYYSAIKALSMAELDEPKTVYNKYPHELSGGMLQRAMIAGAIITNPKLLLADEPTTALDAMVQAEILDLLRRLNEKHEMAILFISHDLNVVRKICKKVIVMKNGVIVETGLADDVFSNPKHEYTKQLIDAIPSRKKADRKDG